MPCQAALGRRFLNSSLVSQGENVFFVITNLVVTPNQRQETCAEVCFGARAGRRWKTPARGRGGGREGLGFPHLQKQEFCPLQGPWPGWGCTPVHVPLLSQGETGSQRVCGPRQGRSLVLPLWWDRLSWEPAGEPLHRRPFSPGRMKAFLTLCALRTVTVLLGSLS